MHGYEHSAGPCAFHAETLFLFRATYPARYGGWRKKRPNILRILQCPTDDHVEAIDLSRFLHAGDCHWSASHHLEFVIPCSRRVVGSTVEIRENLISLGPFAKTVEIMFLVLILRLCT